LKTPLAYRFADLTLPPTLIFFSTHHPYGPTNLLKGKPPPFSPPSIPFPARPFRFSYNKFHPLSPPTVRTHPQRSSNTARKIRPALPSLRATLRFPSRCPFPGLLKKLLPPRQANTCPPAPFCPEKLTAPTRFRPLQNSPPSSVSH